MSVIRLGSNKQYAEGWEKAFGGVTKKKSATKKTAKAAKSAKKKVAPKKTAKKKAAKKR